MDEIFLHNTILQSIDTSGSETPPVDPWILADGYWNDGGIWLDDSYWKDDENS